MNSKRSVVFHDHEQWFSINSSPGRVIVKVIVFHDHEPWFSFTWKSLTMFGWSRVFMIRTSRNNFWRLPGFSWNVKIVDFFPGAQSHLCFIDDLDGDLLAGGDVLGKLHLGEVSFPDGFKKPVFSYVGLLACPPPGHSGARFALTNIKVKNTPEVFRKHIFKFTPPFESLGVF